MPEDDDDEQQMLIERFGAQYKRGHMPVFKEINILSHGCDYGGTSWTTKSEAEEIAERLALAPGRRLLEVGAGSGWPGLYMARLSGCEAVLLDLPYDGLRAASLRSQTDQTLGQCRFVAADAARLPFDGALFDAIHHADVLCCLSAKLAALQACRAVIRDDGTMAFTVIFVPPELSASARDHAAIYGPPFVSSEQSYPEMLETAGWEIVYQADLSQDYGNTVRLVLEAETRRADDLIEIIGQTEYDEKRARRSNALDGFDQGLIRRALYVVKPAT